MITDRKYLDWLRTQPCIITAAVSNDYKSVVPAHIRHGLSGGMAIKPPDNLAIPLHADLHTLQHQLGELAFWNSVPKDHPEFVVSLLKEIARRRYSQWKRS